MEKNKIATLMEDGLISPEDIQAIMNNSMFKKKNYKLEDIEKGVSVSENLLSGIKCTLEREIQDGILTIDGEEDVNRPLNEYHRILIEVPGGLNIDFIHLLESLINNNVRLVLVNILQRSNEKICAVVINIFSTEKQALDNSIEKLLHILELKLNEVNIREYDSVIHILEENGEYSLPYLSLNRTRALFSLMMSDYGDTTLVFNNLDSFEHGFTTKELNNYTPRVPVIDDIDDLEINDSNKERLNNIIKIHKENCDDNDLLMRFKKSIPEEGFILEKKRILDEINLDPKGILKEYFKTAWFTIEDGKIEISIILSSDKNYVVQYIYSLFNGPAGLTLGINDCEFTKLLTTSIKKRTALIKEQFEGRDFK